MPKLQQDIKRKESNQKPISSSGPFTCLHLECLVRNNDLPGVTYVGLGVGLVAPLGAVQILGIAHYELDTPTQCCRGSHYFLLCHYLMIQLSSIILSMFLSLFIFSIPTIILVYYLNPTGTLLHLPLIINAALYMNSLLALLLYQCERCFYPCLKEEVEKQQKSIKLIFCRSAMEHYVDPSQLHDHNERATNHNLYYAPRSGYEGSAASKLKRLTYVYNPFVTVLILAILILYNI